MLKYRLRYQFHQKDHSLYRISWGITQNGKRINETVDKKYKWIIKHLKKMYNLIINKCTPKYQDVTFHLSHCQQTLSLIILSTGKDEEKRFILQVVV